jgi:radical SAM superfamily enzyme YgiQ (UPF0313 family)
MRILLVAPRHPETFWSFKHVLPFVGKRTADPPLGLLTVAAMLPRAWECRLVDLNVERLGDEDIRWADLVMLSAMLVHRESVLEVSGRCRAAGKPVVAGGPLFRPEVLDDYPDIDTFVVGEAEETIGELIADLRADRPGRLYEAGRYPDITRTPIPRWDLIDLRRYASLSVQFSRGCPYNCEFCDIVALNGHVPRLKTAPQMIAELEVLRRRGWDSAVFLVDDNFIGNRGRVKELLRAIADWRRDTGALLTFLTEASVNLAADAELLRLMVAAGFKKVFLGIETPDTASLEACAKFQNVSCDLVEAVHTVQRAGIEVMGGFIVGFDEDKPDIFERQFEFIQRAGVVTAMVGLLQALPRSRLYERLRREGRLLGESGGDNTSVRFNFIPRLDGGFLVDQYRELMRRLYEPDNYYRRIRTFLDEHRRRGPRPRVGRTEVMAFVRSVWVMGITRAGRRAYWRFMFSTLRHHPAQFGLAMTLAIYGHHFRIVARTL